MPRKLPWLVDAAAKKQQSKDLASSTPAPRSKRASSPDDLVDEDLNTTGVSTPERRKRARVVRTPSTSPPPAPPDVEYMHEGFSADDAWMMVEDEFHATAKMYTQHIHHAEYVRLKKLAKARGPGTLHAIMRPTDGRTVQSNALKIRLEAEARAKKTKDGVQSLMEQEESEDDDPYMQDPQLAGLMTGAQRTTQDLTRFAKAKSKTRAAAGYSKSPHEQRAVDRDSGVASRSTSAVPHKRPLSASQERKDNEDTESEEDDDDLDAPITKSQRQKSQPSSISGHYSKLHASTSYPRKTIECSQASNIFKQFAAKSPDQKPSNGRAEARSQHRSPTNPQEDRVDTGINRSSTADDVFALKSSGRSETQSDFLAKRRAAREKREQEEKRKTTQVEDDVPTWLV